MDKKHKIKKVIQIIWNIVSIIFVTFVSGALIINAIKGTDEKTQDIVTPNIQHPIRKQSGYNDQYGHQYYYNACDFTNEYFLSKMIDYLTNIGPSYSDFSPSSDNTISTHWAYHSNSTNSLSGSFYYFANNRYSGYQDVKWVSFSKTSVTDFNFDGGEYRLADYELAFYNSSNLIDSNCILRLSYEIMNPAPTLNISELNGVLIYVYDYFSGISNNYFYRGCYVENDLEGFCLFNEISLNRQDNLTNQYSKGFKDGKAQGYSEGLVDGARGIESNAFTVMGQVFETIADIFSVEILPGFPLWILVFTPLIIAVVIVVVKMIKG